MKLCYIAPSGSIHTKRWLDYFVKKGHEIHLITDDHISWNGVVGHRFTTRMPWHMILRLRRIRELKRLLKEINPDILHAHFVMNYGFWGALSGFSPFVLTLWGSDIFLIPKSRRHLLPTKFSLARADLLTGNSEAVLKTSFNMYDGSCFKAEKISMGVKFENFNPNIRSDVRERLELDNYPVIFSSRRFDSLYNIDIIIEAIPIILKKIPKAKFIFTEKGPLEEELRKRVEVLGVSTSVVFTGYLSEEDYPKYLSIADIVISIPSSDSSPASVLEAMACKKALIISDVDGPKEVIKDGWNGFVVPVRNTEILAERIITLLQNEELRRRFGERGYEIVKEKADYYKYMARMEHLYEELHS